MMDTQRLIALIVFSFASLLLWDAWQKHNAPLVVPAPSAAVQAGVPASTPSAAQQAAVPATATPPVAPGATAPTSSATPPVASEGAGQPVHVRTDLADIEINTAGGDIRRLTLLQVSSARDRTKPLTLMEPNPQHFFVSQSGLLGEGLPSHLSPYTAEASDYKLGDRNSLEVRLKAHAADGSEVTKKFVFHRNSYVVDVSFEVANGSGQAIAPSAYFQFMRDENPPSEDAAQTSKFAGVTTFTGPAVYTEESKFTKIAFSDIDKGKDDAKPRKAKDGWIGMVQHYFVSAWMPPQG